MSMCCDIKSRVFDRMHAHDTQCGRVVRDRETKRDEARWGGGGSGGGESYSAGLTARSFNVNHASSGPTHAYVSLKQPVSRSSRRAHPSRSVSSAVSITQSRCSAEFSSGEFSHASFFSHHTHARARAAAGTRFKQRFISASKRHIPVITADPSRVRWLVLLNLDLHCLTYLGRHNAYVRWYIVRIRIWKLKSESDMI